MADQPSGIVTLVFTDIEGSTRLLEELGQEAYRQALAEHRRIVRKAFARHSGYEVDYEGDAFVYAFASAQDAVSAVREAMSGLEAGPIAIRVGVHTGEPGLDPPKYVGMDVHKAARIMSSGHGGQVLVSQTTAELVDLPLQELGEHRLKDISETVPLYQLGDGSFPPLKTISNTNLPRPASSFVGRDRETEEVVSLLSDGARLVTLSGPGGSGKTRLAIEAASELVPEFKAGVFWVGLATLRDPALVTETITQVLGAKDGLSQHIAERELLLLLDNLEQVIEAAPELGSLLEACPNLKLLCTSRELLRIRGEVEYAVPPLAEPEAVSLFGERARLEPDETIAELCRRLDNLPLAVELAAARTSVLTPEQILERLSQRLDLLKGGRDAEARQQTLRATIEWSYELLSDEEQRLFARLAVFAGGCTLEAAEQVAEADLDTLQSLVDKSLLRFTDGRYWMLETIREFAAERLTEQPNSEVVNERHALWCVQLAEHAWHLSGTDEHSSRLDELERDHANVRAALSWAMEAARNTLALRLGESLWEYWYARGHLEEADRFLSGLLAVDSEGAKEHRAWVVFGAGTIARSRGNAHQASELHAQAFSIFEELGIGVGMGSALSNRAVELALLGDLGAAYESFGRALPMLRDAGEGRVLAYALNNYSYLLCEDRRYDEAAAAADEALEILRAVGDRWGATVTVGSLAVAELGAGRIDRARQLFAEQLTEAVACSATSAISEALEGLASIEARSGRLADAARLWGASEARLEDIGAISESAHDSSVDKERVRAELGAPTFQALHAEGASWAPDAAVEYALSLDRADVAAPSP